jgi:hypothetical protein
MVSIAAIIVRLGCFSQKRLPSYRYISCACASLHLESVSMVSIAFSLFVSQSISLLVRGILLKLNQYPGYEYVFPSTLIR